MRLVAFIFLLSCRLALAEDIIRCGSVWQSYPCGQDTAQAFDQEIDRSLLPLNKQIARLRKKAGKELDEIPTVIDQAESLCQKLESIKLCQAAVIKAEILLNQQIERQNKQRLAALKLALEQQKIQQRERKLKIDQKKVESAQRGSRGKR